MVGFEREEYARRVFNIVRVECPMLKHGAFLKIIEAFRPDFAQGLYESRPCHRILRYVGRQDILYDPHEPPFKKGERCESEEFNGATYRIRGYDGRMGCAYFEVVE